MLQSELFTTPHRDAKLDTCLLRDDAHIVPGARGDHVKKIQIALNRLSEGPGLENFKLAVDGQYGAKTAAAVKIYKNAPSRRILQPTQKSADDIVGKRTIESLDNEMQILESEVPLFSGFICEFSGGAPHNHARCPGPPRVSGVLFEGRADHLGTPLNPRGGIGRKINIFGEGETDYLGFTDFATDPQFAGNRPLTSTLKAGEASDICMRSAPINQNTHNEIKRIARPIALGGCRFTYASNQNTFRTPTALITGLGIVIAQGRVTRPTDSQSIEDDMEVWVIEIRK
jgi:hypothetical protein